MNDHLPFIIPVSVGVALRYFFQITQERRGRTSTGWKSSKLTVKVEQKQELNDTFYRIEYTQDFMRTSNICTNKTTFILLLGLLLFLFDPRRYNGCMGFMVSLGGSERRMYKTRMTVLRNDGEDFADDESTFGDDGGVLLEDLSWRVEKLRLEEQNKKRFLKSRARFLPYDDCRRWVQAWGQHWKTAKDWNDWIAMGEKRNSYIPSRPDEYYGRLGQWVSWEHFLLTPPDSNKKK